MWLACSALTASAHQPYESSALARLEGEGIELTVTASLDIAKLLLEKTAESGSPHEQLLKVCAGLYEVMGEGGALQPQRVFYNEKEGEAIFSAIYPPPRPGELRFRALYLDKLPPGYGGTIRIVGDAGKILGFQSRLRRGDANNLIAVSIKPEPAEPPAEPAAAPSAVPAPVISNLARSRLAPEPGWQVMPVIAAAVVLLAAVSAWLLVRNKPKEKSHV